MKWILRQYTESERYVITNMKLHLDEWQDYLDEKGFNIHVRSRTLMLSDDEMKDFWLYRQFGLILPKCEDYDTPKADTNVNYTPIMLDPRFRVGGKIEIDDGSEAMLRGTCYVFDEIHTVFPSRAWQQTPRHFNFYTSQHGKLNDEFIFMTQALKNCDPIVYRNSQDFTYTRNHRLEKFGIFKGENKFTAKTYLEPRNTDGMVACEIEKFGFDPKQAALYDTAAGVGMPGGGKADGGAKKKGIPIKTVWLGLAALLILGVSVVKVGGSYLTKQFISPVVNPSELTKKAPKLPGTNVAKVDTPRFDENPFPVLAIAQTRAKSSSEARAAVQDPQPGLSPDAVRVRGYVMRGGKVNVMLSDGRTLIEGDAGLEKIQRNGVVLYGEKLYMVTPDPRVLPLKSDPVPAIKSGFSEDAVSPERSEGDGLSREAKTSPVERERRVAPIEDLPPTASTGSSMSGFDSKTIRRTPGNSARR